MFSSLRPSNYCNNISYFGGEIKPFGPILQAMMSIWKEEKITCPKYNASEKLLSEDVKIIRCQNFNISSNNFRYKHPFFSQSTSTFYRSNSNSIIAYPIPPG
jgi:hypothetical protein